MEIVKTDHSLLLDDYKNLILKRDRIKKEAFMIDQEYLRVFGRLIEKSYKLHVECICLKKKIAYCQRCVNHNQKIIKSELENHIDYIMKVYQEELDTFIENVNNTHKTEEISTKEAKEIKKIYHKIAKSIHPDMHPELFEDPDIKELWERAMIAYTCNNLEEIREIEILVSTIDTKENKPHFELEDLKKKIEKLNKEIDKIMNSEPYVYKELLMSQKRVIMHKENIMNEIEEYENYKSDLEDILESYNVIDMVS